MGRPSRIDLDQGDSTKRFYDYIWPHRAVVLRSAQILTNDIHDAEDLAQETMVKAFKAIERFVPGSSAKNWLMAILRNCRIDRVRTKAATAREVSLDQLSVEPAGTAMNEMVGEDGYDNPQDVLNRFSDQQVINA